ncbi:hypothetical protein ES703_117718 [subsurface metagenome]
MFFLSPPYEGGWGVEFPRASSFADACDVRTKQILPTCESLDRICIRAKSSRSRTDEDRKTPVSELNFTLVFARVFTAHSTADFTRVLTGKIALDLKQNSATQDRKRSFATGSK